MSYENLNKHFSLASKDLEEVKVSASKVTGRADKLDSLNFEEVSTLDNEKIENQRAQLNVIRS